MIQKWKLNIFLIDFGGLGGLQGGQKKLKPSKIMKKNHIKSGMIIKFLFFSFIGTTI